MKKKFILLFLPIFFIKHIQGQDLQNTIYNKDFNWTITIPKDFKKATISQKERDLVKKAVEKAGNVKFTKSNSIKIFAFRLDTLNYLDSSYQILDSHVIDNYKKEVKNMNNLLFKTLRGNSPNSKLDSISSTEKIDDLTFTKFHLIINDKINMIVYKRLFGKKDLTFNILYNDPKKGLEILQAFKNSRFK